ncbi:type II CRISPR-associated endonuclease Cas1 [Alloscardovia theropitheci]|uniref:CRISPR-associated endonuclease Cas1 n=1 Tax=Alloscardovia theropitheci TaxID=2496842 RepID=A0A4R0QY29_9BIFI|nr:type II CRISPR-associated endonuclease Cas1 [Alloscardovia theropitheci]TCD54451.1 type II CRISPR-associated endonuclease Cas1 [Alloscardovia theropitheci]
MSWRNVVVTKHSKVSTKLNHLVIQTDEDSFQIPLSDIGNIIIDTTRAVITTHAVSECMEKKIKIIFCDSRGIPIGETVPYAVQTNRVPNIRRQLNWDKERRDILWQRIVQEKIAHQAQVLEEIECPDWKDVYSLANAVQVGDPDNREAVAAHMYFPRLFTYEFTRSDESHPINALLNYGYAILLSETCRQVSLAGYLTEIGVHHESDKNPYNLASDLMEPFRPYVDKAIGSMELKELNPQTKIELVSLLLGEIPELHGKLSRVIECFVQDCLRYLAGDEKVPQLGYYS